MPDVSRYEERGRWWRKSDDGRVFTRTVSGESIEYLYTLVADTAGTERHALSYVCGDRRLSLTVTVGRRRSDAQSHPSSADTLTWNVGHSWVAESLVGGKPFPSYSGWFLVDDAVEDAFRVWPDGTSLGPPPKLITIDDWFGPPVFLNREDNGLTRDYLRVRWIMHRAGRDDVAPQGRGALTSPYRPVPSDFLDGRIFQMYDPPPQHSERVDSELVQQCNYLHNTQTFTLMRVDPRDNWTEFGRKRLALIRSFPDTLGHPALFGFNNYPSPWLECSQIHPALCFIRPCGDGSSDILFSTSPIMPHSIAAQAGMYIDYGGRADGDSWSPARGDLAWPNYCAVPDYLSWRLTNEILSHLFLHPPPWFRTRQDRPPIGRVRSVTTLGGFANGTWTDDAVAVYARAPRPQLFERANP